MIDARSATYNRAMSWVSYEYNIQGELYLAANYLCRLQVLCVAIKFELGALVVCRRQWRCEDINIINVVACAI
jgi:hypothetical protein